jgi:hypothetical protein
MKKQQQLLIWIFLSISIYTQSQTIFQRDVDFNTWLPSHMNFNTFSGAAWGDLNSDGFPDIIIPPDAVFFNNGDGTFTRDLNTNIGSNFLVFARNVSGITMADVDNDDDLDVFINCSRPGANTANRDALYLNDGVGTFTLDTLGPWNPLEVSWGAAWADFDNNGFVDLVTAHPSGFLSHPRPSSFFINLDGDPAHFVKDTSYGFTRILAPYTVPYWSDYDMDGDQDLFIASGPGGAPGFDSVYTNLLTETQTATFQFNKESFANDIQDGQCYNFIDFDNDGDKDLFLTNWSGVPNNFYINDGGTFINTTMPFNYNNSSLTNAWGDVDNDGDLDVLITNHNGRQLELWLNDGFTFIRAEEDFCNQYGNAGIFLADMNNDGFLDAYATGANRSGAFYVNRAIHANHWIGLTLKGNPSNRAAIGTNIRVVANINGQSVSQLREISAQNAFQGHHDLRQHVGLGDADMVDSIMVYWPSGLKEYYTDVASDGFYTIMEGQGMEYSAIDENTPSKIASYFSLFPNPSRDSITILKSNASIEVTHTAIYDLQGKLIQNIPNTLEGQEIFIDIKSLSPGTYFIHMDTNNHKIFAKKFVKY